MLPVLPLRAPHDTLEEAAASCIAELRQIQPHGPYLLGGFSGGGLTAWEMSRQLRAAGEDVAIVVLLDTPMPMPTPLSRADRAMIKAAEPWTGGRVVLYRPPLDRRWKVTGGNWVNSGREYVFADNEWTPYAPRIEVVEVPGDHDSMVLEPNVRVLAARLRAALADAETTTTAEDPARKLAAE